MNSSSSERQADVHDLVAGDRDYAHGGEDQEGAEEEGDYSVELVATGQADEDEGGDDGDGLGDVRPEVARGGGEDEGAGLSGGAGDLNDNTQVYQRGDDHGHQAEANADLSLADDEPSYSLVEDEEPTSAD